jgi:sporulation protein YlmC with PRC-barrel domain
MKRLILSLSLMLVLALVVAGCAPAEQSDTGFGETGLPGEATPAAGVTEESGAVPEESVVEAPAVTEEPVVEAPVATEESMAEAPAATEEPIVEAPAATEEALAEAPAAGAIDEAEVIPPTGAVNLNSMSNLLDFEVWNSNNEQIGNVNAIVIDKDTSQIEYVIFGTGGFLGLGEKEIPVPWQVLQLKEAVAMETGSSAEDGEMQAVETPQNAFILDITQAELEQTPEFDLTSLYEPQTSDAAALQALEQEIQSFWQSDLSQSQTDSTNQQSDQVAQASGAKNLVLADDLLGATIQGEAAGMIDESQQDTTDQSAGDATQVDTAQDLGTVEEIMVNINTGQVTYLLVSLNVASTLGAEEAPAGDVQEPSVDGVQGSPTGEQAGTQVVPVPLTALEWNAEEAVLIYTGSESLDQAPTINLNEIVSDPSMTDWKSEADSFWGVGSDVETD